MTTAGTPTTPGRDTVDAAIQSTEASLAADGWAIERLDWADRRPLVARKAKFKLRWMATRLHTFVVAIPLYGGENGAWMDQALQAVRQHAQRTKGGLPGGFQTGVAVIAAGIGENLSPDLHDWASRAHGRGWAAITHPVALDLATGHLTQAKRPAIGAIYYSHLRNTVASHLNTDRSNH